nr:uncharacterized protein LOC129452618 [Misgurnus anguillicaudatus]
MIQQTGVFGVDGYEVKSVSVMEGDSVLLDPDITEILTDDQILWMFKINNTETCIVEIYKRHNVRFLEDDGRFRDKLKLDNQTGSLIITNFNITNTGLYDLQIINNKGTVYKRFNVTVYAPLPVPIIMRNTSQCSSSSSSSERSSVSKCVLLCSVMNVRDVSLSWYKGNSLLSSISVSDLNIRLSLPLEVDYQNNNTYRCVLNNTNINQTQHLNINHLCQCSGSEETPHNRSHWPVLAAVVLLILAAVALVVKREMKQYNKEPNSDEVPVLPVSNGVKHHD